MEAWLEEISKRSRRREEKPLLGSQKIGGEVTPLMLQKPQPVDMTFQWLIIKSLHWQGDSPSQKKNQRRPYFREGRVVNFNKALMRGNQVEPKASLPEDQWCISTRMNLQLIERLLLKVSTLLWMFSPSRRLWRKGIQKKNLKTRCLLQKERLLSKKRTLWNRYSLKTIRMIQIHFIL